MRYWKKDKRGLSAWEIIPKSWGKGKEEQREYKNKQAAREIIFPPEEPLYFLENSVFH